MARADRRGFTLVELLIVVIILGIIAAVAIPKFTSSTDDAKEAAVEVDLRHLRNAVERYALEHGGAYPGAMKDDGSGPVGSAAEAATAFVRQMTAYSNSSGLAKDLKDPGVPYGPYFKKGLPLNPYNGSNGVTVDVTNNDITVAAGNAADGTGWKFYIHTGRVIPNHRTGIVQGPQDLMIMD